MENSSSSTPGAAGSQESGGAGATLMDQAKQQAQGAVQQTQQKAGQVMDQAKQQAKSQLAVQKDRAVDGLSSVAEALRNTGQQLHDSQQGVVGQYADSAADLVDRVSGYLHERELEDLVVEVETFARRNPVMFLTGAFLIGFGAARFLKSSSSGGGGGGNQDNGFSSGGRRSGGAIEGGSLSPARRDGGYGGGNVYGASSVGTELPSAYDVAAERSGSSGTDAEGSMTSSGFESAPGLTGGTEAGTSTAFDEMPGLGGPDGEEMGATSAGATTGGGDQR